MRLPILRSLALSAAASVVVHAQQLTISGAVVDRARSVPVVGATVRISGTAAATTDRSGHFRFVQVVPGSYVVSVEAIGYQFRTLGVTVTADTVLRIEMEARTSTLEPMIVRAGNVTIKGTLRDAVTHRRLLAAYVTLYPGARGVGATTGDFSFADVPKGERATLVVEAIEYLPVQVALVTNADTSVDIALQVDSVGLRLIAQQSKRLAVRSGGVALPVKAIGRDQLANTPELSLGTIIRQRLPSGVIPDNPTRVQRLPCIFIDDQPSDFGLAASVPAELIDRVEIYGQRMAMLRVYTKRYVASLMREPSLSRIVYMPNGLKVVCW